MHKVASSTPHQAGYRRAIFSVVQLVVHRHSERLGVASVASSAHIEGRPAIELLLEHGLHAMTMDNVAEQAGVSKATIYRWWSSKELLALDALATDWAIDLPPTRPAIDNLREQLLDRFRPWLRRLGKKPYGRVIAGLVAETQTDPEFAKLYREHFVQPRRDDTRLLLRRAIDRGEIPANTNLDVTLDLLYGPIYHRMLHGHARLDDQFLRDVVDTTLRGIAWDPHHKA